jgi:hypothetical protein
MSLGSSGILNRLLGMDETTGSARIYLLDADERHVPTNAPALVDSDGVRHELPPLVYKAVQHVIDAMRSGFAVKVTPYRTELPIDEAAYAIGMRSDMLRKYVADGVLPFRSTEYVDWVRLVDVLEFDHERRRQRREGLNQFLDEFPWDEEPGDEPPADERGQ